MRFSKTKKNKRGGPPRPEGSFINFRSFVTVNGLWDVKHFGNLFSWRGMRSQHLVHARLDRSISNNAWIEEFPAGHCEYLRFEGSDHRPLLTFIDDTRVKKKGMFRFDNLGMCVNGFVLLPN